MMALMSAMPARAAVVEYTSKAQWQSAAGAYTTIQFNELPNGTWITDQYDHVGALFTDGSDQVFFNQNGFPNDGYGLNAAFDETTIEFTQSIFTIAADCPGGLRFTLFYRGVQTYLSSPFSGDPFAFAGLVSDQPFDKVLIMDPSGGTFVDDLYFGPPIPGSGAWAVVACFVLGGRRGR